VALFLNLILVTEKIKKNHYSDNTIFGTEILKKLISHLFVQSFVIQCLPSHITSFVEEHQM